MLINSILAYRPSCAADARRRRPMRSMLIYPILSYRPCAHLSNFVIPPMCSFIRFWHIAHVLPCRYSYKLRPPSTHSITGHMLDVTLHSSTTRVTVTCLESTCNNWLLSAHTAHTRHTAHATWPGSLPFAALPASGRVLCASPLHVPATPAGQRTSTQSPITPALLRQYGMITIQRRPWLVFAD